MHILIVEDDDRLATLIQRVLEENDYHSTIAYDGSSGLKLGQQHDYNLIITDIVLPKMDGIEMCKTLRLAKPDVPIIMLTALGTTNDKVEGFDAGADDYLVKPFDFRELLVRIRALLKRGSNSNKTKSFLLTYADLAINNQTKTVSRSGIEINLTPKEFKLLEYMVENCDRVLSRTEIAEKVWDTHFDTGTNFIDVYVNYLRKKIDRDFEIKLIHTKPGMGFIFKIP